MSDDKPAAKNLVRFDFPPGATPEQIAEGIKNLADAPPARKKHEQCDLSEEEIEIATSDPRPDAPPDDGRAHPNYPLPPGWTEVLPECNPAWFTPEFWDEEERKDAEEAQAAIDILKKLK